MILSCTNHYAQGNIYLYRLRSPQHPRYHPIVFLHSIPRQPGSFGDGRELRDLRVEVHIIPQLALLLCQLFWRSDARKLLHREPRARRQRQNCAGQPDRRVVRRVDGRAGPAGQHQNQRKG